jgi:hypothetical protein
VATHKTLHVTCMSVVRVRVLRCPAHGFFVV